MNESYLYDETGQRVRKTNNLTGVSTFYPVGGYEQTGSNVTKQYSFGGRFVAVRGPSGALSFLLQDQLGSTVYVLDAYSNKQAGRGYYTFGATRFSEGAMPTEYHYTGQREDGTGLYYYNSRFYDPQIGSFISPDTIVPDPTKLIDYNRYLYAAGNPVKYNDPSGHFTEEQLIGWYGDNWRDKFSAEWQQLLLDVPGSEIMGAQLGDVFSIVDEGGAASQYVLVQSASGNSLSLWDPTAKTAAPLTDFGGKSPAALGLYRIVGGESGEPSNYWSYLTGGTKSLPDINGYADSQNGMYRLRRVLEAGQAELLAQESGIPVEWFMGSRSGAGLFVTSYRAYRGIGDDLIGPAGAGFSAGSLLGMIFEGVTLIGGTATVGGAAVAAYQLPTFQNVYYLQSCPTGAGWWCQ